jgi:hypothetical protein
LFSEADETMELWISGNCLANLAVPVWLVVNNTKLANVSLGRTR